MEGVYFDGIGGGRPHGQSKTEANPKLPMKEAGHARRAWVVGGVAWW